MKQIIKYPVSTEKSIRMMEAENKIIFIIDRKATKADVKKAIEELFNVKVDSVRTFIDVTGKKKAYVKFNEASPAIDVATKLGMM
jgi:large subunit ribosomal protein L23